MTFLDWLFSNYPAGSAIDGAWGVLHILTLLSAIAIIVGLAFLFRSKSEKTRRIVMIVIAALICFFELARRSINLAKGGAYLDGEFNLNRLLKTLLPRPWCAISCWSLMASVAVDKKFFYNFAASSSLLCVLVFFAYPSAGFNHKVILFENVYSIASHTLLLIGAVSLITLKFTDFDFKKGVWKELVYLAVTFIYGFIEIYLLKIEADPLYFMPNNEIQEIVGLGYPLYLILYILFLCVFFSAFYAIQYFANKKKIPIKG